MVKPFSRPGARAFAEQVRRLSAAVRFRGLCPVNLAADVEQVAGTFRERHFKVWPMVMPGDNGILPRHNPHACYYCRARIGQLHKPKCVTVLKKTQFTVLMGGVCAGTYTLNEPHYIGPADAEGAMNSGNWCISNALPNIEWFDSRFKEHLDVLTAGKCACCRLTFKFKCVVNPGPIIYVKDS